MLLIFTIFLLTVNFCTSQSADPPQCHPGCEDDRKCCMQGGKAACFLKQLECCGDQVCQDGFRCIPPIGKDGYICQEAPRCKNDGSCPTDQTCCNTGLNKYCVPYGQCYCGARQCQSGERCEYFDEQLKCVPEEGTCSLNRLCDTKVSGTDFRGDCCLTTGQCMGFGQRCCDKILCDFGQDCGHTDAKQPACIPQTFRSADMCSAKGCGKGEFCYHFGDNGTYSACVGNSMVTCGNAACSRDQACQLRTNNPPLCVTRQKQLGECNLECPRGQHCCTASGTLLCVDEEQKCCGSAFCQIGQKCERDNQNQTICVHDPMKHTIKTQCKDNQCPTGSKCCAGICTLAGQECCAGVIICEFGQSCNTDQTCSPLPLPKTKHCKEDINCGNGMKCHPHGDYRSCVAEEMEACGSTVCGLGQSCSQPNSNQVPVCGKRKQPGECSQQCPSNDEHCCLVNGRQSCVKNDHECCGNFVCYPGLTCVSKRGKQQFCLPIEQQGGRSCDINQPCPAGQECCDFGVHEQCVQQGQCASGMCSGTRCLSDERCDYSYRIPTCVKYGDDNQCDISCGAGKKCCRLAGEQVCVSSDRECCGESICGRGYRCFKSRDANEIFRCFTDWTKEITTDGTPICTLGHDCSTGEECCHNGCMAKGEICCKRGHICSKGQICDDVEEKCYNSPETEIRCNDDVSCAGNEQCCYGADKVNNQYYCLTNEYVCCGGHYCFANYTCTETGCTSLTFSQPCPKMCHESSEPDCCYVETQDGHRSDKCVPKGSVCCSSATGTYSCPGNTRCGNDEFLSCLRINETPCPESEECGNGELCCVDNNSKNKRRYCPPHGESCDP